MHFLISTIPNIDQMVAVVFFYTHHGLLKQERELKFIIWIDIVSNSITF